MLRRQIHWRRNGGGGGLKWIRGRSLVRLDRYPPRRAVFALIFCQGRLQIDCNGSEQETECEVSFEARAPADIDK